MIPFPFTFLVGVIVVLLIYSVAASLLVVMLGNRLIEQRDGAERLVQLQYRERFDSPILGDFRDADRPARSRVNGTG